MNSKTIVFIGWASRFEDSSFILKGPICTATGLLLCPHILGKIHNGPWFNYGFLQIQFLHGWFIVFSPVSGSLNTRKNWISINQDGHLQIAVLIRPSLMVGLLNKLLNT
jgi:hypothetical protein